MAFCKYCGSEIPEGGVCSCPQAQAEAQAAAAPQQPYQQPYQQAYPQQPYPQQPAGPSATATASAAAKSIVPYFKSFFSNPMQAIRGVVESDNLTLAITLTIVRALAFGLGLFGVMKLFCADASTSSEVLQADFFSSLLYGALIAVIAMALFILASFAVAKIQKSTMSIKSAYEASAANGVLVTALLLLTFVCSFLSQKLSMVVLALAFLSWIVCGVLTTQMLSTDSNSGVFWLCYIVGVALVIYISYKFLPDLWLNVKIKADTEVLTFKKYFDDNWYGEPKIGQILLSFFYELVD